VIRARTEMNNWCSKCDSSVLEVWEHEHTSRKKGVFTFSRKLSYFLNVTL
jgi:hypothetical protein